MGTRGALGVYIDGQTKATYNHFDSYPSGLGRGMVEAVRNILNDPDRGLDWLREKARALEMWPHGQDATPEMIAKLGHYADTGVATKKLTDPYVLMRRMQGDITAYLEAGIMEDGGEEFMADSLFCEYAYIINLDTGMLEFYEGFQKQPHTKGRYANAPNEKAHRTDQFYPVALKGQFLLTAIPDDWESRLWPEEDEDDDPDDDGDGTIVSID
jgi:hypothetical protein